MKTEKRILELLKSGPKTPLEMSYELRRSQDTIKRNLLTLLAADKVLRHRTTAKAGHPYLYLLSTPDAKAEIAACKCIYCEQAREEERRWSRAYERVNIKW